MLPVLEKGIEKQCKLTSCKENKAKIKELENHIDLQNRRIEELVKANQKLDNQCQLLKEDKDRALSEVGKTVQTQMVTDVKLRGQDPEYSQEYINQIAQLTQKNEALSQEVARLLEKQAKTNSPLLSAKKMITEERQATASAAQQTEDPYILVEILEQHLHVYADDFAKEQSYREKIQAGQHRLKEKLRTSEDKIAFLRKQVCIYQHCFNRERNKREGLQQQICCQGLASVVQDSHDLHSNVMAKFEELKQQVHMLIQGATNGRTDQEHVQAIRELKQKLKACEELIAFLMELLLGPEIIRSAVP